MLTTLDLLNELEKVCGLVDLPTEQGFLNAVNQDRAIVYLLVNWSGPEYVSRYVVFDAFSHLGKSGIPIFKIDCSDQSKEYVVDWLVKQRENKKEFYYGGWGETLLVSKGQIVDFLKNPAKLGKEETRNKIAEWINASAPLGSNK